MVSRSSISLILMGLPSGDVFTKIGKISTQPHTSLCMQNKLIKHALYCFLRQWPSEYIHSIKMGLVASAFFSLFSYSFFSLPPLFFYFSLTQSLTSFFFFFSFGFTLGLPRTLTLHLIFGLAVHLLCHYTTVIC